jgi:glycosyltransferase involved in cell wall biosynthesis
MYLSISAVVFTKNEQENIEDCISSLRCFSEIFVVDSQSTDDTKKLAIDLNVSLVDFEWNGMYPKKRQWSLDNISFQNDWILFIDADERVTSDLLEELKEFMANDSSNYSAGSIPLDYFFAGRRLKFGQRPKKTVLLKIGCVSFPVIDDLSAAGMGELEGHYQPQVNGRVKKFTSRIQHNDNDAIATWMIRHINYAKWEAHLLINKSSKIKVDLAKGFLPSIFHNLPLRPFLFFIYSYLVRLGFLDGKAGFDYAFAKSWYYWLSGVIAREEKHNVRKP